MKILSNPVYIMVIAFSLVVLGGLIIAATEEEVSVVPTPMIQELAEPHQKTSQMGGYVISGDFDKTEVFNGPQVGIIVRTEEGCVVGASYNPESSQWIWSQDQVQCEVDKGGGLSCFYFGGTFQIRYKE